MEEEPLGLKIHNPEHDLWLAAEQLLVGWLYNSMTPETATQVMGHDEAKKLWDSIQEYYGIQSRSQEDYNRLMLQQTRKGTMKMHDYLDTMKRYFDNLQVASFPMDMRSFVSHVTTGSEEEYTPIVCVIRSQNFSWSEIQLELFSFEQRLERLQSLKGNISVNLSSTHLPFVNVANAEGPRQPSHDQNTNHFQPSRNYSSANNTYQHRGYSSNRGNRYCARGRYSPYPPNNRAICQLCGKMGHTAVICHHRYDKADFSPSGAPPANTAHSSPPESSTTTPTALRPIPRLSKIHRGI